MGLNGIFIDIYIYVFPPDKEELGEEEGYSGDCCDSYTARGAVPSRNVGSSGCRVALGCVTPPPAPDSLLLLLLETRVEQGMPTRTGLATVGAATPLCAGDPGGGAGGPHHAGRGGLIVVLLLSWVAFAVQGLGVRDPSEQGTESCAPGQGPSTGFSFPSLRGGSQGPGRAAGA